MIVRPNAAAARAILTGGLDVFDGAAITLYDGTQPGEGGAAVTTQEEVAVGVLSTPAFGTAAGRGRPVATFWDLVGVEGADAETPTWGRIEASGGEIIDLDAGAEESGAALELESLEISEDDVVRVSAGEAFLPDNDES